VYRIFEKTVTPLLMDDEKELVESSVTEILNDYFEWSLEEKVNYVLDTKSVLYFIESKDQQYISEYPVVTGSPSVVFIILFMY
jgi:hypothetical protein